jgi:hypothetical protein
MSDKTDDLINHFAAALREKLTAAEQKYGYDDAWLNGDWRDDLVRKLQEHVQKGDPRDVAAYCAFAWHHGWSVAPASPAQPADAVERVAEAFYLAMYENDGGDWRAVETKDVWREKALRVMAALSAPRTAAQDAAAARIAELEKALRPSTAVGASLLRSVNEPLPPGCYCKPGQCMAPKIMGRQMPCRDPQKAALPADDATGR